MIGENTTYDAVKIRLLDSMGPMLILLWRDGATQQQHHKYGIIQNYINDSDSEKSESGWRQPGEERAEAPGISIWSRFYPIFP